MRTSSVPRERDYCLVLERMPGRSRRGKVGIIIAYLAGLVLFHYCECSTLRLARTELKATNSQLIFFRAILLIINLGLILGTSIFASEYDPALQNWATAGSGTEGLDWYPTDFTKDIIPIPCHSHNDYWRRVPLFSALRAGCTGVEADVYLKNDDLFVGHSWASLTANRTFQSLYVNPLVKILSQQNPQTEFYNGTSNGVFDTYPNQTIVLLIDVKTGGRDTWPWVLKQLEPLREKGWLSFMENGVLYQRPVTIVGTGNTPFDLLTANETRRDTFFDAPLELMWEPRNSSSSDDTLLDPDTPSTFVPPEAHVDSGQGMTGITADSSFSSLNSYYASVKFGKAVGKIWRGTLTKEQVGIIRGHVRGAHRRGLKVRYWDLPSWPVGLRNHVWHVLVKEGVDYLNVDDLRGVSKLSW